MGRAAKIFFLGVIILGISMLFPVVGIPGVLIGLAMITWGGISFWFGAAKGAVKGGVILAKKAAGDKTGSGKL